LASYSDGFIDGYARGFRDALQQLGSRGVITETAAPLVMSGPSGMAQAVERAVTEAPKPKKRRSNKARASDRKLSAAFKEANRRYRKKDGSLRSGRSQADIARLAHKLKKKM
jgi:hypothetical protein